MGVWRLPVWPTSVPVPTDEPDILLDRWICPECPVVPHYRQLLALSLRKCSLGDIRALLCCMGSGGDEPLVPDDPRGVSGFLGNAGVGDFRGSSEARVKPWTSVCG